MKTYKLIDLKGQLNLGDVVSPIGPGYGVGEQHVITGISKVGVVISSIYYEWGHRIELEIIHSKTGFERDEITWDNLHVGDQWRDMAGDICTCQGIVGQLIVCTYQSSYGTTFYDISPLSKLKENNVFKLIQPTKQEDILELTVEEVSKKFGKTVKIVEGKK